MPPAITVHVYADDHALMKEFNSSLPQEEDTAQSLSDSLDNVKEWMNSCLKMNSDKSEVILCGSWQQIMKCRLRALEVCGVTIPYSESIKY